MTENTQTKKKLMIVDDDPDILLTLGTLFREEGFDVYTAENGIECLNQLDKGFRGLILLDIMMPYMDGWETMRNMELAGFMDDNVIVVILSARRIPDQEMDQFDAYIRDYITKPFDIKRLIVALKKYTK